MKGVSETNVTNVVENDLNSQFVVDEKTKALAMPKPVKNMPLEFIKFLNPENVKYFSVKVEKRRIIDISNSKLNPQSVRVGNSNKMEQKAKRLEEQRKKFGLVFNVKNNQYEDMVKTSTIDSDDKTQNTTSTDDPRTDNQLKEKAKILADLHKNTDNKQPIPEANTIQELGQATSDEEEDF